MTPIRIGASCARTSLPPRPAAARVAAEFLRSDLRDVTGAMMSSLWMLRGRARCRSFFGEYLKNLLRSQRARQTGQLPSAGPDRARVAHACERAQPVAGIPGKAVFCDGHHVL